MRDREAEFLAQLSEQDPDYICDVLGITTYELLQAFPKRVQWHVQAEAYTEDPPPEGENAE
ncbi:MAG TPA: hypothetical protein VE222_05375 [Nitrospiraceae bacterium]|jgi:hypothetical protein|nr:hypothetical protein [Nitrospiraceae bacterium]